MNNVDKVKRRTTNRDIFNWMENCVRFYTDRLKAKFIKRVWNIWVFSAWEGTKYSDNSKYLYEYIEQNYPEIECYWITKNENVYNGLIKSNHKVCLVGTKESQEIQSKAGVAFYTHGLDDFGDTPYIFGAKLVCLWHAAPVIKKNYYTRQLHHNYRDNLAKIKAYIFSYIYRDITIATSEYAAENFRQESLIKKGVVVLGQPRNDIVISDKLGIEDVLRKDFIVRYNLNDNYKFIIYLPTYRGTETSQKYLENLIQNIANNAELNCFLKENNIKLLMKMHYLTDISNVTFTDNIIFLDDRDVSDTQRLLALADLLITDYSSCSIDFALKSKEIVYFVPDLDTYEKENGLYDEFVDLIARYRINSVDELVNKIKGSYDRNFISTGVTDEVNKLYNSGNSLPGEYCKDVTKYILDRLK